MRTGALAPFFILGLLQLFCLICYQWDACALCHRAPAHGLQVEFVDKIVENLLFVLINVCLYLKYLCKNGV